MDLTTWFHDLLLHNIVSKANFPRGGAFSVSGPTISRYRGNNQEKEKQEPRQLSRLSFGLFEPRCMRNVFLP